MQEDFSEGDDAADLQVEDLLQTGDTIEVGGG